MTRADDLVQVTEVALEAALARFREQGQKVAGLRREIEALDAQRDAAMAPTPSLAQAAQSELWRNWLHRKRRAHVSDLATALAEYERLRSLAQRTFGRAEAARALSSDQKRKHRLAATRRAVSESPGNTTGP